jgi:hypothetical protein
MACVGWVAGKHQYSIKTCSYEAYYFFKPSSDAGDAEAAATAGDLVINNITEHAIRKL